MEITEPEIKKEEILILKDPHFLRENVCIVTGCGTGIGRATAAVAAVNGLTVAGFDINVVEGEKTTQLVEAMGGRMIFFPVDLCNDNAVEQAVARAAALGTIRYLANIAGIQHIDTIDNFPMEKYDLMQRLMLRAPLPAVQADYPTYEKKWRRPRSYR